MFTNFSNSMHSHHLLLAGNLPGCTTALEPNIFRTLILLKTPPTKHTFVYPWIKIWCSSTFSILLHSLCSHNLAKTTYLPGYYPGLDLKTFNHFKCINPSHDFSCPPSLPHLGTQVWMFLMVSKILPFLSFLLLWYVLPWYCAAVETKAILSSLWRSHSFSKHKT